MIEEFDFIVLLETWLKENHCNDYSLNGYVLQHFYRTAICQKAKRGSGGIAVYIKEHLVRGLEQVQDTELKVIDDRVWYRLHKSFFGLENDLYIGLWYIPPSYSCRHTQTEEMWAYFEKEISYFQMKGDLIIMGDLNARTGEKCDWIELDDRDNLPLPDEYAVDTCIKPRVSMDKNVNSCGERLIDICIATGLKIVNGRFGTDEGLGKLTCNTYNGGSVIDYVLTEPAYFRHLCEFRVRDPLIVSDHCPIQLEIACQVLESPAEEPQLIQHCESNETHRKFKIDPTNMDCFLEEINKQERVPVLKANIESMDVTESSKLLEDHIRHIALDSGLLLHSRSKKMKRPHNCWFDDECKSQKCVTNKALKTWKTNLTNSILKEAFYEEKRKLKNLTRLKKREYMKAKNSALSLRNPKEFWRRINLRKRRKQSKLPQSVTATQWFDHFRGLHQMKDTHQTFTPPLSVVDDTLDASISTEEAYDVMQQMKSGKAPGMDGIMIDIYKVLPPHYLNLLVCLWNKILQTSQIPQHWCTGIIIPVLKSGDKLDVNNYRGITLLPVMAKVLFAILSKRLYVWAETKQIIPVEQFGFRANHRTVDAMFVLNALIENAKAKRKNIYSCFVDFKKAFDSVQHHLLWQKLSSIGVSTKLLKLLIDTYAKGRCCVQLRSNLTESFKCDVGVRQGCPLSPILFILFTCDLLHELKHCNGVMLSSCRIPGLMFADDLVLLADNPKDLQSALNALSDYCFKWALTVNESKTRTLVFGNRQCSFTWTYNGSMLQQVSSYRYLGVVYSQNGLFTTAVKTLCHSALKVIYLIKSIYRENCGLSPDVMCSLYSAMVQPILEYGCEIWGVKCYSTLERIPLKFCKDMLGLPLNASNIAVYGETGTYPQWLRNYYRAVKYYVRIHNSAPCLVVDALELLKKTSGRNWNNTLCGILKQYEPCQSTTASEISLLGVGRGLQESFITKWKEDLWNDKRISGGNKLRTYRSFKVVFAWEHYLSAVTNRSHLTALARFRTSCHSLEIETGRYHKPPIPCEQRVCRICKSGEVEDEHHFVLDCQPLDHLRHNLLKTVLKYHPNFSASSKAEKLVYLFETNNGHIIRKLAWYIYTSLQHRQQILFSP